MIPSVASLSGLIQKLEKINKTSLNKQVFIGFDGFVDKIKKAVKQKQNFKTEYFKSLSEFADRIQSAAGKSGQIEMVTQRIRAGGNAPILANTLGKFGIRSYCLGSLGYPLKHVVFNELNKNCEVVTVLDPGETDAIEFEDGKIMFSELGVYGNYNWKYIKDTIDLEKIKLAIQKSQLLAFVDWVNLPHASDIWEGVLNDVIKPSKRDDYLFLFDLCDPSKKTVEQIDEVLDLISSFSPYGQVTLGLNENETLKIWTAIHGINANDPIERSSMPNVFEAGHSLYKSMDVDYLLIHPIDRTIVFHNREAMEIQGRLVTRPKVLTGGGDNLNAGYCLGLLSNLTLEQSMLLGMATSGAYIQNGVSPDIKEIIDYIGVWIEDIRKQEENSKHTFTHRHE